MNFSFFQFAFFNFSFNLERYQNELEAENIAYKLIRKEDGQYLYAKTDKEKDSLKYYMKKMDRVIERNGIRPSEIDYYCNIIGEYQKDTSIIKHAIKWSNWVLTKNQYHDYYKTNLYLMFEIGDYKGCINLLNKMEKRNVQIPEKESKMELAFLKAECLTELKKYTEALNIIKSLEKNQLEEYFQHELDFLKARCLLETKQYSNTLTIISVLENKELDKDYIFGLNFLKAKCFVEQKQYAKALNIINNLEKSQPEDNEKFKKELTNLKQICLTNLPTSN
jgi:tetratricopeptide (TPR) repeat protein